MRRGRHDTKRAAVNAALAEYINVHRRRELLALRGRVRWGGDLEQLRKSRVRMSMAAALIERARYSAGDDLAR